MPTYEFRCPDGHTFERFYRSISGGESEVPCPECGKTAKRQMSAGAGLLFKGSGFYLTDYGKNAHRGGDSPAEKAGLILNDVIESLDGERISGVYSFWRRVRLHKPGETLSLIIRRGREAKPLQAVLAELPESSSTNPIVYGVKVRSLQPVDRRAKPGTFLGELPHLGQAEDLEAA